MTIAPISPPHTHTYTGTLHQSTDAHTTTTFCPYSTHTMYACIDCHCDHSLPFLPTPISALLRGVFRPPHNQCRLFPEAAQQRLHSSCLTANQGWQLSYTTMHVSYNVNTWMSSQHAWSHTQFSIIMCIIRAYSSCTLYIHLHTAIHVCRNRSTQQRHITSNGL